MAQSDNLDGLLSPFLRQRRFEAAAPFIRGRVLDFGCGIGLLASLPGITDYVGVDVDEAALAVAATRNPGRRFISPRLISSINDERFDTVVALAVIEHLPDPVGFLIQMAGFLAADGRIVLTTPNPTLDWVHGLGARIGIFAKESHDEHQSLMGRGRLSEAAAAAGMRMSHFRRFLCGANQLAVLEP